MGFSDALVDFEFVTLVGAKPVARRGEEVLELTESPILLRSVAPEGHVAGVTAAAVIPQNEGHRKPK
jgi:hypothetical protein